MINFIPNYFFNIKILKLIIILKIFLKANVDQVDKQFKTALLYAFELRLNINWHTYKSVEKMIILEIISLLIEESCIETLDYASPNSGRNALFQTVLSGDLNSFMMLLERNVKTNLFDNYFNTPLIYAICQQDVRMVRELLKKGADVNATDAQSKTCLMWAFSSKTVLKEMAKLVLNKTLSVNMMKLNEIAEILLGSKNVYLDAHDFQKRSLIDYINDQDDFNSKKIFMRFVLGFMFLYFSKSSPEKIRNDVIKSFRKPTKTHFPLQTIHFEALKMFKRKILEQKNIQDLCKGFDFIIYFITPDFQVFTFG